MIKVNLASKKRPTSVSAARAGGTGGLNLSVDMNNLGGLWSEVKEFPLRKIGIILLVGVVSTVLVNSYEDDQLKAQTGELDKLNAEKPKLQAEANKMKGLEDLQKSMLADEKVIRSKLETIQKLTADRASTLKLLMELAKITPPEVWLSDVELKGSDVTLKGFSQDLGRISDFMKQVQNSSTFADVVPSDTQTTQDEQKHEVASFRLLAKKR